MDWKSYFFTEEVVEDNNPKKRPAGNNPQGARRPNGQPSAQQQRQRQPQQYAGQPQQRQQQAQQNYGYTEFKPVEQRRPQPQNKAQKLPVKFNKISEEQMKTIRFFAPHVLLFVAILYFELVFKLSTTVEPLGMSLFYILLFSFCWAVPGVVLSSSFNTKINNIIHGVLLGIMTLMFLVEYFIYLQFKVCYDLKTIANGSNDVFNGFIGTILKLIFSFPGISHIILFAIPMTVFVLCIKKGIYSCEKTSYAFRGIFLLAVPFVHFICLGTIFVNNKYNDSYSKLYNYQDAVANFGLMTGVRLDFGRMTDDSAGGDFDIVTTPSGATNASESAGSDNTAETSANGGGNNPINNVFVPQPNTLDIDFNALASSSDGKISSVNSYVASLTPSYTNKYTGMFEGKNLIMVCAEAFSGSVIDKDLTPTLYRLSTKGINFTDFYVPASAGTTGGEYSFIFSMLPVDGGKSVKEMAVDGNNIFTMGNILNRRNYYGKMYHNNSYTYYDRNKTHNQMGYSDGFMGYGNGMENYVKKAWPQSDLQMIQGTVPTFINKQPFNIYYMSVSGHSEYTKSGNSMTAKNWSRVQNLPYSDLVKGYYAAQLELEDALTDLINQLEAAGIADDTVIVLCADHFPYGLDAEGKLKNMPYLSELYGYNVTNYFERDKNTLIIWSGSLEKEEPIVVDTPVTSLDITPTLLNLFGCKWDSRLFPGRDVFSEAPAIAFNINYNWKTELGSYYGGEFHANEGVTIPDGYVDSITKIVKNKVNYCGTVQSKNYFKWLCENTNIKEQLMDDYKKTGT